jgi:hypothetical protein
MLEPHSLLARSTFDPLNPIRAANVTFGALLDQMHHQTAPANIVIAKARVVEQNNLISWNTGFAEIVRYADELHNFSRYLYGFELLHKRGCLEM